MGHTTFLITFLLICIQQGCLGVPVNTLTQGEHTYSFRGYIDTRSSACDERIARWSITGNLTTQNIGNYWIFQLDNLKTGLFNGPKADLHLSREEDIPAEVEVLKQPFKLTLDMVFSVTPNEPLWSINLKRSIASNFHDLVEGKIAEKSVFGDCEVFYEFKDKHNVVKKINHDTCKDKPFKHETNVRPAPAPEGFNPIMRETVIDIKYDAQNGQHHIRGINSVSKLTYKPMPKSPNTQHVDQHLELELVSSLPEFYRIMTDKLTEKRNIYYEYGNEETNDRRKYVTDSKVLVQQFMDNYDKFEKFLEQTPIENQQNTTKYPLENMFLTMHEMPDENGFKELRDRVENSINYEKYATFMSVLSYIGTKPSVDYIKHIILKEDFEVAPLDGIKLLATFPAYINEPTNELVQSFEEIINVENVKTDSIRNGRILSFASVVARAIQKGMLSEENLQKYQKLYHDKYLGSEKYDQKMIYLLGLVNMAEGLSDDFIISIISNNSESANLRSLALAGFKNKLQNSDANKIFTTFWPMVQDKKENFDVRVAAFDLLLSSGLNEDQFNTILEVYKKYQADDIYGKHLANYFLTTIESYQNNTAYLEPIGNFATAALENEHFPKFSRAWTTGNYRLAYSDSDPNLGSYIQAQLTANPVLNTISTVQFSYNDFGLSFDTGVYSVYLKLQGAIEYFYKNNFFKHVNKDTTIPELLQIIKTFDYKMKKVQQDIHVEIVVFVDGKAVYTANINSENYQEKQKGLVDIIELLMENQFTISYPILDYIQIPSILGTPINVVNDMLQLTNFVYRKNDFLYRSSWSFQTWLESYNPILDTTIASYKLYSDEIGFRTRASTSLLNLGAAWTIKNDTYNWTWDKLIGTTVKDEDILKRFCPVCEAIHEIPTWLTKTDRLYKDEDWGMTINRTIERNTLNTKSTSEEFTSFLETYHSSAQAFPYAKPFLVLLPFRKNVYWFHRELERGSYRIIPNHEDGIQTLVKIDKEGEIFTHTVDPFEDTYYNISLYTINQKLYYDDDDDDADDGVISSWELTLELISTHNHTDEHGNKKVKMTQNIHYHMYYNDKEGNKICSSRVELLPALRSDKFSLLPTEETTATHVILKDDHPINSTDYTCSNNRSITLTESFIVTEEVNKKVKESANYKECQKDSKGLSFTPPTRACMASFIAGSQYNYYKVYADIKNVSVLNGTGLDLFEFSRVGNNKIHISLFETAFSRFGLKPNEKSYIDYTSYFPYQTKNPAADVYRDNDIMAGIKRSCIVTPKRIRSFTGHNIPNDGRKQAAFVECFEHGERGMTIEKISETHVGFKFWSKTNTIDATVHEDKIKIALNGDVLAESHLAKEDNIRVRFLDKNVVLIADEKINIYYNTEYIYIKASSIYNDLICGVCSQE